MRRFLLCALATTMAAATFSPDAVRAADISCGTAKLIVPWKPGGDTDIIFRMVANSYNELGFKPRLQVVNISGQSGNKGAKEVMAAKPDGCTLLAMHESQITTYLAGRVDFTWDVFTPVARLTYTPSVIGANVDVPYNNADELVKFGEKHSGEIKAGVSTGSTSQFVMLLIEDAARIELKYIPYEGTRDRLTALLSKNIDIGEMNILTAKKYIAEGSVKALGIATEERDPLKPDLKTLKEQGINVVYGLHRGVMLPKGAPKDVIKHYEQALRKAMDAPALKKSLDEKGTWRVWLDSDDYAKFLGKSYADHEKVAIKIGMYKK